MAEPTEGPLEYQNERRLEAPLYDVLERISRPNALLFTVKHGGPGCLLLQNWLCSSIPAPWMKTLVNKAYIGPEIGSRNKVACMGWTQYVITADGTQALHLRYD